MRLRTTAGAYAGQVRDYDAVAGRAALRSGMAERLDQADDPPLVPQTSSEPAAPVMTPRQRRGKVS